MSKREDEDFEKWMGERVADLRGKDPEAAKALESLANSPAGRDLYRGSLREAEFYQRLNAFNEEKKTAEQKLAQEREEFQRAVAEQTSWYKKAKPEYDTSVKKAEEYKKKLDAYEAKLKEMGLENPNPPAATPPAHNEDLANLTKLVAEQSTRLEQMDRVFPQIMTQMAEVAFQSNKEGFNVPPSEIMKTVFADNVSPLAAYERLTKDERVKRAQAELDRRIAEARDEGKKEALSSLLNPGRIPQSAPTMIDTLRSGEAPGLTDPVARRDAAMAEFLELTQGA